MALEFDFLTRPERSGMDALAVDFSGDGDGSMAPRRPKEGFSLIPMWVADMNFVAAPSVTEALVARASHPSYGYFETRPEYYASIIRWQKELHGVEGLGREQIGYENGVLGGLATCVAAFTTPNEPILLHSPTYIGFTGCITRLGRQIIHSPLVKDSDGIWRMDYEDMEQKIRENHIRFAVFCSPHNPTGGVWTREEIEKAMRIYEENDVLVISDEIWCDILLNGNEHIPTQSVSEDARKRTIALYAPSKTFNLAGLIGSYHIIYNPYLKDRVSRQSRITGYNDMNVLSQHALIGAYSEAGQRWVMELRQVLSENVNYSVSFIRENFPGVNVSTPQGTYMLFPDIAEYLERTGKTYMEVLSAGWEVGVAWQNGRPFHGETNIRMNLALPAKWVKEAFERLKQYVFTEK